MMFSQLVAINSEIHAHKKLKPVTDARFASDVHAATVMVPEFGPSAACFPIMFLEDKAAQSFRPVALLGLVRGENLFIDAQGQWQANYMPAILRRYPFSLARQSESDQFLVCIDGEPGLIDDVEGTPLFNADGTPSQLLENTRNFLIALQRMEEATHEFCRVLASFELFTPVTLKFPHQGETHEVSGCFGIDESRLNALAPEQFAQLREKGYLPAIYAHLVSVFQVENLIKRRVQAQARAASPATQAAPSEPAAAEKLAPPASASSAPAAAKPAPKTQASKPAAGNKSSSKKRR